MLLRTRIVIVFAATAILLILMIGAPVLVLMRADAQRMADVMRVNQSVLWKQSLALSSGALLDKARLLVEAPELAQLRAAQDRAGLDRRLQEAVAAAESVAANAGGTGPMQRVEIGGADGGLVASSAGMGQEETMVEGPAVLRTLATSPLAVGVEIAGGQSVAVVSVPIADGGFLSVSAPLQVALDDMAASVGAEAVLLDAAGRVLATSAGLSSADLDATMVEQAREASRLELQGRLYMLVGSPVLNSSGTAVTTLATLRDITLESQERQILLLVTAGVLVVTLSTVLLLLYGSIIGSLRPLDDVAEAVRTLARGDTMATLAVPDRRDEVGKIIESVAVFRQHAITLDQVAFSARIERAQQEALIRQEMLTMARTLAPEARADVLADLAQIEDKARRQSGPGQGSAVGGVLSTAFKQMVGRVLDQHRALSDLLAERTRDLDIVRQALTERSQLTRMREELEVARTLQLSSLPAQFPAFPGRTEFDLFATLRPAKEVGGDFYDFLMLGRDRLVMMIGDASGKGVSAAIFIAMARSLMRAHVGRGNSPADCLAFANDALCVENHSMMFATAFMAVLDLSTGRLTYACAGHNPPFLRRADGSLVQLNGSMGTALGVIEEMVYTDVEIDIAPADTLLLYSDGATDAFAADESMFGDAGVIGSLQRRDDADAERIIHRLIDDIDRFAGDMEQADDITLLCLRLLHLSAAGAGINAAQDPVAAAG